MKQKKCVKKDCCAIPEDEFFGEAKRCKMNEVEDNSIGAIKHKSRTIAEWERLLKNEYGFTQEQIWKMINTGVDLERFLLNLDESASQPEDVVTVQDFIDLLEKRTDLDDKVMFRADKKTASLFDVNSKGGTAVIDIVSAKRDDETLDEDELTNEGRSWVRGGFGGTGRSYRSLGREAPRGKDIGWYEVYELDPKAKGKVFGWRCGPSNFPFQDLLYPERKYKVGTMVMRNKHVNAGSMSGQYYIAIPSYFDAIKNNDKDAINIIQQLGIPLDLTFGMNPNDDYSVTYN